ncbi:MAG: hypothetical protein V4521_02160 [Pseudomonadota bacterium]
MAELEKGIDLMASKISDTRRDRSRSTDAKAATLRRRGQRRTKTALFLAWAFPADLAGLKGSN